MSKEVGKKVGDPPQKDPCPEFSQRKYSPKQQAVPHLGACVLLSQVTVADEASRAENAADTTEKEVFPPSPQIPPQFPILGSTCPSIFLGGIMPATNLVATARTFLREDTSRSSADQKIMPLSPMEVALAEEKLPTEDLPFTLLHLGARPAVFSFDNQDSTPRSDEVKSDAGGTAK